jgi:outer membrane protein assembly factor BamB
MLAIRPDGKGDVTETHVAWRMGGKEVPLTTSPVVVNGLLYMLSDNGIMNCMEVSSGKVVWREQMGGSCIASAIHDNDKVYVFGLSGKTTIIRAGRSFEKLGENILESGCMASPAVAGDSLIIRTKTHVYHVGAK